MPGGRGAGPDVLGEGRSAPASTEARHPPQERIHLYGQGQIDGCRRVHVRGSGHDSRMRKEGVGFVAGHPENQDRRK